MLALKKTGLINLILTNTSATPATIELFNSYSTFIEYDNIKIPKPPGFSRIPISVHQQIIRMQGGTWDNGTIGYGAFGEMEMYNDAGTARLAIQYSTAQNIVSYKALLEFLKANTIKIKTIRMTVITGSTAQFQNDVVKKSYNVFGDNKEDERINPVKSVNPSNIQPNIIIVPFDWNIDGYTAVELILNANTTIEFNCDTIIL